MISRSKNFVFVHVPKTAGNALQGALLAHADDELVLDASKHQDGVERFDLHDRRTGMRKHSTIADYASTLDREFFEGAIRIATVRNPWDRCISFYFFDNKQPPFTAGRSGPSERPFDEDQFAAVIRATSRYRESLCLRGWLGRFQPIERHRITRLLRFENLQAGFDSLADDLGISRAPLPRRNATLHRPYVEYYSERTRRLVRDRFIEDIEYFGYRFGDE